MSLLSRPYFHDEAAAYVHLETVLWADGVACPHCGTVGDAYVLEGVRSRPTKDGKPGKLRYGLKKCGACRQQFTVTVGTVFKSAHIPLHKMLQAVYLMCASKKGISAHQLHRTLEITYKSAWFLCHRIREAMRTGNLPPMGGEGKIVEADTTYTGGKEKNKHVGKRNAKAIGGVGKQIVHTLVERGGEARSHHIANIDGKTLAPILLRQVNRKSELMTDTAGGYYRIGKAFANHEMVDHGANEYVRGKAHSNTVEGYFSLLKRGIIGVYHHVSEAHLRRYLAEFDFRYSNRMALGIEDEKRSGKALTGIVGKRLTYGGPRSV